MNKTVFILFILLTFVATRLNAQGYDYPSPYGLGYNRILALYSLKLPVLADTQRLSVEAGSGDIIYVTGTGATPQGIWAIVGDKYTMIPTSQIDTTSLSNRINQKLDKADTASLSARIDDKLTKGGDSPGATLSAGTKDANIFDLKTNNTVRLRLPSAGGGIFGSTSAIGASVWQFIGSTHIRQNVNSNSAALRVENESTHSPFYFQTFAGGFTQMQANLEWDGSNYRYTTNGYASVIRFLDGSGNIKFSILPFATAGSTALNLIDLLSARQDSIVNVHQVFGIGHTSGNVPIYGQVYSGGFAQIQGNLKFMGGNYYRTTGTYGTIFRVMDGNGGFKFATAASSSAGSTATLTDRVVITNGGSVGIEDMSPLYMLTVGNGDLFGIDNTGKRNYATGSNRAVGFATLSSGTVTVNNTLVTANSGITVTAQNCNNCGIYHIGTKTAGTSFVINSSDNTDASTIFYEIIN